MKQDEKTRIFLFEEQPLMVLGIKALIHKEDKLELSGSSSRHETLIDELKATEADAVILDLPLYSQESIDLLRDVRSAFPELGIILLSVHSEAAYVAKARAAGADSYVLKIEEPEKILDAVRATVAGSNYVSDLISQSGKTAAPSIDSPINLLSKQEFQILQRIGKGNTNRQISEDLSLPIKTIESEIATIQEKLGLSSSVELLQFAFHWVHHEGGFS